MSLSAEPPLTRRAAREFARATGEQPTVAEPPSTQVAVLDELGQPLTRRRLRELRAAGVMVDTAAVTIEVEPEPVPESSVVEAPIVAEPEPAPVEPVPLDPEAVAEPEPAVVEPEAVVASAVVAEAASSSFAPPATDAAPSWTAPEGHWTRQLADEDEDDALETTYSREVGSASPTTSALIIPEVPATVDLGGPLDSTGGILLTGSIPLSESFAATGSIDRLSDADADRDDRFDDHRLHETAQDGQPVRAAAVASQHALGTPIVSDGKGRGHRGLTVLLIAASALAVVVTGLVIAAIALKLI